MLPGNAVILFFDTSKYLSDGKTPTLNGNDLT